MEVKIVVRRLYRKADYTIGNLYINDKFFCNTLEDPDRGLDSSMTLAQIKSTKVYGDTAIPYGKYFLTLDTVSPKYSNFTKYPYVKKYKGKMPRILGIKGFDGVLIHAGNTQKDTYGCLLVGENKVKGKVINSQATWQKLMEKLYEYKSAGNAVFTIEFKKGYEK